MGKGESLETATACYVCLNRMNALATVLSQVTDFAFTKAQTRSVCSREEMDVYADVILAPVSKHR